MKTVTKNGVTTVVAQNEVVIPDLTIKDLLSVIPSVPPLLLSSLSALDLCPLTPCCLPERIASSVRPSAPRFMCKFIPPHFVRRAAHDRV